MKAYDGGLHNNNEYSWGGKTAIGKWHEDAIGDYDDDWNDLVDGSNSERLCGFNNWRVPTIEELRSIVDYSRIEIHLIFQILLSILIGVRYLM